MTDQQVSALDCLQQIAIALTQRRQQQFIQQNSAAATRMHNALDQRWILFLRGRNIRSRRNESETGADNLFAVELRSGDDDVLTPRLQLHRQRHVRMNVAVRADGCQHDSLAHMPVPVCLVLRLLLELSQSGDLAGPHCSDLTRVSFYTQSAVGFKAASSTVDRLATVCYTYS